MDVWSVGCVLYELRSKKKLYKACVPCNIRLRMIETITGKQIPEHVLRAAYKRRKRHADETLLRGEQGDVCLAPLSEEEGQDARARADVILSVLSDSQDFKDLFLRCIEPDPLQRMKAAAFREHAFFEPLGWALVSAHHLFLSFVFLSSTPFPPLLLIFLCCLVCFQISPLPPFINHFVSAPLTPSLRLAPDPEEACRQVVACWSSTCRLTSCRTMRTAQLKARALQQLWGSLTVSLTRPSSTWRRCWT